MNTKRFRPSFVRSAALLFFVVLATLAVGVVASAAEQAQGRQYVLGIEGMSCPIGCAPKVQETLEHVDGVESAIVNFDDKQAIVRMAPGKSLTKESCDAAFGNSGYWVSSFDEKAAASDDSGS